MSCVNIDGKRNVQVAHDGRLLKNMTRRITPKVDEDGLAYVMIQSRTDPKTQERRYLKVLVFEHHSTIAGVHRAKLTKDDVDIVDEEKGVHISNLRLTDSGLDKVEGQAGAKVESEFDAEKKVDAAFDDENDGETEDDVEKEDDVAAEGPGEDEEGPSAQPESQGTDAASDGTSAEGTQEVATVTHPVPEVKDEDEDEPEDAGEAEDKAEAVDGDDTDEDEEDEAVEAEEKVEYETPVLTAVPTTPGGSYYDLIDTDGNNVLDTYNEGKKVNGQKNLDDISTEYAVLIEIEE